MTCRLSRAPSVSPKPYQLTVPFGVQAVLTLTNGQGGAKKQLFKTAATQFRVKRIYPAFSPVCVF